MAGVKSEVATGATEPAAPPGAGPGPWQFGIKDVLCIGPIVAHLIYSYAGYPLNALIGTHPERDDR